MKKRLTIPNFLTMMRIVGSIVLFAFPPLTVGFFIVYTVCGVSDALDGLVARATGQASEFGAKLDSIADLLFYAAMVLKILPLLIEILPAWLWCGVGVVLLIRLLTYLTVAVKYHHFAAQHTYLNKLTSLMMFLLPYLMELEATVGYCTAECAVAGLAAVEELCIHLKGKDYDPDRKSIFIKGSEAQ